MKYVAAVARWLFGLAFFLSGLNYFVPFFTIPAPLDPGRQFLELLVMTKFMIVVKGIELVSGILILSRRYEPLGLTLLAPVLVNIFLFHLLMDPKGLPVGIGVVLAWMLVAWECRGNFASLFAPPTTRCCPKPKDVHPLTTPETRD